MSDESGEPRPEDTFKILLATDTHLGYMDNDPERRDDSLNAFEEVLQIATSNKVDFILMAGDIFHENRPSRYAMNGCIVLLRRYCLGSRENESEQNQNPVRFEVVSDQSVNFETNSFHWTNFEDPNLRVSLPIFTIHGNHDDPAGSSHLSPIDIVSSAGLINYFGKVSSLESVELFPLLLRKGDTKLALFGIGALRDQRLQQMFVRRCVKALRPASDADRWFNIFVLHQNRAAHNADNFIPESCIPSFIDLVVWGHEHECRIDPEWNPVQKFYIVQPGSTIVTSLSEGEELPKHVALLHIWQKSFKLEKIPLKSVRRLYMETISLDDKLVQQLVKEKSLEKYFIDKVEEILAKAERERCGNPKQPAAPLVRIRSDLPLEFQDGSDGCKLSSVRFGQHFVGRVANPKSLIHFIRKKSHHAAPLLDKGAVEIFENDLDHSRVEDVVKAYFASAEKQHRLFVMSEKNFCDAVKYSADKEDRDFINFFIDHQIERVQQELNQHWASVTEDQLAERIRRLKSQISQSTDIEVLERQRSKQKSSTGARANAASSISVTTIKRPSGDRGCIFPSGNSEPDGDVLDVEDGFEGTSLPQATSSDKRRRRGTTNADRLEDRLNPAKREKHESDEVAQRVADEILSLDEPADGKRSKPKGCRATRRRQK